MGDDLVKGVMLYGSANRDEDVFGPNAESFDVTRSPNPHIAFGTGEHSCLGAQLARIEARIMLGPATEQLAHLGSTYPQEAR